MHSTVLVPLHSAKLLMSMILKTKFVYKNLKNDMTIYCLSQKKLNKVIKAVNICDSLLNLSTINAR